MNELFEYTAYENGEPVRTFEIGEANPLFPPFLRRIPLSAFGDYAKWGARPEDLKITGPAKYYLAGPDKIALK